MSLPNSGSAISGVSTPLTFDLTKPLMTTRPGASAGERQPSMRNHDANRHDTLLGILNEINALSPAELITSDLPEQADRLLNEINAARRTPVKATEKRHFQLLPKKNAVDRLVAKLEVASRRGDLPTPYPIDQDPLELSKWTRQSDPRDIIKAAKKFPELQSALFSYVNASGVNHLSGRVQLGKLINMEIELFSKRQWQMIPAADAVNSGPAANFILLIKASLLHYPRDFIVGKVQKSIQEFIESRSKEDIVELIHCCRKFEWPQVLRIAIPDKIKFSDVTRDDPVENVMIDAIVYSIANDTSKAHFLKLLKSINPERVEQALCNMDSNQSPTGSPRG